MKPIISSRNHVFLLFFGMMVLAGSSLVAAADIHDQKNDDDKNNDSSETTEKVKFLWSSSGGGWRSMFATMGFANLFQQAGLFYASEPSNFTAISTNSGSAWFSTQAFFSSEFYNQVVMASNPTALREFAKQWMESYGSVARNFEQHDICQKIVNVTSSDAFGSICDMLFDYNGQWAAFIEDMLEVASGDYGDPNFIYQQASPSNRIEPLQQTDLLIQTALVPNYRTQAQTINQVVPPLSGKVGTTTSTSSSFPSQETIVSLGPIDDKSKVYSVVLSAAYTVNKTFVGFQYSSSSSSSSSSTGSSDPSPLQADKLDILGDPKHANTNSAIGNNNNIFQEYQDYNLHKPPQDATVEIPRINILSNLVAQSSSTGTVVMPVGAGSMRQPFSTTTDTQVESSGSAGDGDERSGNGNHGIAASVVQVAAASSAVMGHLSPAGPATFAQALSKLKTKAATNFKTTQLFNQIVNRLYQAPILDGLGVCTQWPEPCDGLDGLLIDGGFVNGPTISTNIGQYARMADGNDDNEKTPPLLKLVHTNTNDKWDIPQTYTQLLQYFSTPENEGIQPGDFIWFDALKLPFQSPQIFENYLDEQSLNDLIEPIDGGSRITTAHLKNLITVDNPAYGVTAGLRVEILLINLNEPITTFIVGPTLIEETTEPISDMVYSIASNQVLRQRVRDFFFG